MRRYGTPRSLAGIEGQAPRLSEQGMPGLWSQALGRSLYQLCILFSKHMLNSKQPTRLTQSESLFSVY